MAVEPLYRLLRMPLFAFIEFANFYPYLVELGKCPVLAVISGQMREKFGRFANWARAEDSRVFLE